MAKTLKDFLNERQLGPMVVKNPDEQKFIDKHAIAKVADRNGNDDEVFKGSKVKMADRPSHRKGYNPGQDEEVYEELKGNQHKIDANKNGKIDGHDFKLLRSKKKKVAEEVEELDESWDPAYTGAGKKHHTIRALDYKKKAANHLAIANGRAVKDSPQYHSDMAKHHSAMAEHIKSSFIAGSSRAGSMANAKQEYKEHKAKAKEFSNKSSMSEEVEDLEELSTATLQSYRKKARAQGNAIVDKMKLGGGDWSKDQKDTKTLRKRAAGAQASGKQLVKRGESLKTEEVDQIQELSKNTLRSYVDKRATQRDLTSHDIVRKNIAAASGVKPRNKPESAASTRSYHRAINKIVKDKDSPDRPKVLATEEVEQIDELSKGTLGRYAQKAKNQMGRDEYRAGVRMGQRDGRGQDAMEKAHNKRADKRHRGLTMAIDKLAKEETEIEEKLDMKKASMGTVIKDFQKSDAPQFQGKSQKKRQVMAIAAKLSAERGGKPLNKEERLLANLGDLAETHKRTLLSVFAKLNEDNQRKFMAACETPEGVEQMLDFAIQNRGE